MAGAGEDSQNMSRCNACSSSLSLRAPLTSPSKAQRHIAANFLGATLPVTVITPSPPQSMNAMAVESSPEYRAKSSGARRTKSQARAMLPVASFSPTMCSSSATRSAVSLLMSTTVRPGTL